MSIIPAKTPSFVKSLFPNFIWNIDTNSKELYLTFDDGPTPEITEWVLSTLKGFDAQATFFCIGNNIKKHPDILKAIIDDGHTVGNHTYNHLKGWQHKTKDYLEDIEHTQSLINLQVKPSKQQLFRPPYGRFKVKQSRKIRERGYKIIMWDVLSFDWDNTVSETACLEKVTSAAKEGSIIVFHDSVKASRNLKFALPRVLEYYSSKGYEFKRL